MEVARLKEYLLENDKVVDVLEDLGCHHIANKGNYITCGNPDGGDNKSAITVYTDSENLTVIDYTRTLVDSKRTTDLLDLIAYFKGFNFIETMKYLCDFCGLDYYEKPEELPESLQILKFLSSMQKEDENEEDDAPLQPISEKVLGYYLPLVNDMFLKNGEIDYKTQQEWGIMYDAEQNRILIPIRDMLGNLISFKARLFKDKVDDDELKYYYYYPCPRRKLLFGLNKTIEYIKETGIVYIVEAEKGCMSLWSFGYRNSVSTMGKKISQEQINMLVRLNARLVFCFDKDVQEDELKEIASQFPENLPIWAIIDKDNILDDKESPSDHQSKWLHLVQNNVYKIK